MANLSKGFYLGLINSPFAKAPKTLTPHPSPSGKGEQNQGGGSAVRLSAHVEALRPLIARVYAGQKR